MNKRASHVGMILSFMIFVTFLAFLFSITQPAIKVQKDKEFLLEYLKSELLEKQFIEEMAEVSVTIDSEITETCVELINFLGEADVDEEIVVKNSSGDKAYAKVSNPNLEFSTEDDDTFFKVYSSEEFEKPGDILNGCASLDGDSYVIESVRSDNYIFESKINVGITGFDDLKNSLNIPAGSDFSFGFEDEEGGFSETGQKDVSVDVFSEEIPIQYVDDEANIKSGFLTIRIW